MVHNINRYISSSYIKITYNFFSSGVSLEWIRSMYIITLVKERRINSGFQNDVQFEYYFSILMYAYLIEKYVDITKNSDILLHV